QEDIRSYQSKPGSAHLIRDFNLSVIYFSQKEQQTVKTAFSEALKEKGLYFVGTAREDTVPVYEVVEKGFSLSFEEELLKDLKNHLKEPEKIQQDLESIEKTRSEKILPFLLELIFDEKTENKKTEELLIEAVKRLRPGSVAGGRTPFFHGFFDEKGGIYQNTRKVIGMLPEGLGRAGTEKLRVNVCGGISEFNDGFHFFDAERLAVLLWEKGLKNFEIVISMDEAQKFTLEKKGSYPIEYFIGEEPLRQEQKKRIKNVFDFTADGQLCVKEDIRRNLNVKKVLLSDFKTEKKFHIILYNFIEYKLSLMEKIDLPLLTNIVAGNIVNNLEIDGLLLTTAERWFDDSYLIRRLPTDPAVQIKTSSRYGGRHLEGEAAIYKKTAAKYEKAKLDVMFDELLETIRSKKPDANTAILEIAYGIAKDVHSKQTRVNGEPYLFHPLRVAGILVDEFNIFDAASDDRSRMKDFYEALIAAALLHDIKEDYEENLPEYGEKNTLLDKVKKKFLKAATPEAAEMIIKYVEQLTKKSGAKKDDKKYIRKLLKDGNKFVQTIKLADRMHNLSTPKYKDSMKKVREYLMETWGFARESKIPEKLKNIFKRKMEILYQKGRIMGDSSFHEGQTDFTLFDSVKKASAKPNHPVNRMVKELGKYLPAKGYLGQLMLEAVREQKPDSKMLRVCTDNFFIEIPFTRIRGKLKKRQARDKAGYITGLIEKAERISRLPYLPAEKGKFHIQNHMNAIIQMAGSPEIMLLVFEEKLRSLKTASRLEYDNLFREITEIYAPLAERLGLETLSQRFRDEALKRMRWGSVYESIRSEIAKEKGVSYEKVEEYLELVKEKLSKKLKDAGINADVSKRVKGIFQLMEKMRAKKLDISEVFDFLGIMAIFESEEDLRKAAGISHDLGKIKQPELKRKEKYGYEEFDMVIEDENGVSCEFQFMTKENYEIYNHGFAAH
ncbi:MAG: hypothetical protein KKG95_00090, partial [Candidatus Omnitrophica bacterium]|nr:hypothetical protein [Candidatus Omnitrophota bacterium]